MISADPRLSKNHTPEGLGNRPSKGGASRTLRRPARQPASGRVKDAATLHGVLGHGLNRPTTDGSENHPHPAHSSLITSWKYNPKSCYTSRMSDQITTRKIESWAVPTPEDDDLWQSMSRDEQLAALQEHFSSPETTTTTDVTVAEIVERVRQKRKAKQATHGRPDL